MSEVILALNAGSSSIKFGLFEIGNDRTPVEITRGEIDDDGKSPSHAPLSELLTRSPSLVAVGHRIVHGGTRFVAPVRLDEDVIAALHRLTPLAPLHQPRCLEPVAALKSLRPDIVQIGCFDTAFHHQLEPPVSRYAIPWEYEAKGVRRYGFHGLSYAYIASRLEEMGLAARKTVVAHLGSGASLCAMREGRSVDTTMGFSALAGVVMATRCGTIDPGILLWLQQECGLDTKSLEDMLYHHSGLLGVSGISGDMRVLLASEDTKAEEAVALFTFSVAREVAMMAHTLGGLECLVFTGGIGQHASEVRLRVCRDLRWLGVIVDQDANHRGSRLISGVASSGGGPCPCDGRATDHCPQRH